MWGRYTSTYLFSCHHSFYPPQSISNANLWGRPDIFYFRSTNLTPTSGQSPSGKALSVTVSLSRMPKRVPGHTLCPWCLHAWEVQTPAIWSRHQSASVFSFWIQAQSIIPLKCWSHRPIHGRYSENTHFLSAPCSSDTCSICMLRCWLDARCLPGAMWPSRLIWRECVLSLCLIDLKALLRWQNGEFKCI